MKIDYPDESQIPALKALWREAFGETDDPEPFFRTAFYPLRARCVTLDGNVAAALYWMDVTCRERKMAYLYAVATARAYRGRGICHQLMINTRELLREQGYEGILLVPAGPELEKFYEGMGYRTATTIREFLCSPGPDAAVYHPVDRQEYAMRRREFLPEGSVIQEGANLAYLETMAEFYEGPNFLLAAVRTEDSLQGLELLGDPHAGPEILRALGIPRGTFRTPGEGENFAMFQPLVSGCQAPAYFGFAFD